MQLRDCDVCNLIFCRMLCWALKFLPSTQKEATLAGMTTQLDTCQGSVCTHMALHCVLELTQRLLEDTQSKECPTECR